MYRNISILDRENLLRNKFNKFSYEPNELLDLDSILKYLDYLVFYILCSKLIFIGRLSI